MNSLWKMKMNIGIFLTTIFMLLSYEVKNPLLPGFQWLLVILSFVISTYAANKLTEFLMNFRWGRAFVLGKSWVEGYWYLKTNINSKDNAISNDGIVFITYEGDQHELNVFTYRLKTPSVDSGFSSVSELVTARDFDTKFSNYFLIPEGDRSTHGITVGKFFRDVRRPRKSDHEVAKLSYGGGTRRIDRRSWMLDQGWSGEGLEIGLPERKAQHATKRSEVECGAWSGGSPISPRPGLGEL